MDIQATSLIRVVACNGSVGMESAALSIPMPTEDAQEGTAAHHVASAVLSGLVADPLDYVDRQTPNGIYVTPDMADHVSSFTDEILSRQYDGEAIFGVEQPTDFEISGTSVVIRARPDFFAYDPGSQTLYIDDLKYGFRIHEPQGNWVLIAYALSVIFRYQIAPVNIVMTIHQPRPFHSEGPVRPWRVSYGELMQYWAWLYAKLAALDNELHTGPHCRKCKALATCPAARMAGMNSVEASTTAFNDDIPDEALAFEIDNLRRAQDMLKVRLEATENLAAHRIKIGRKVGDFTVEQKFGHRAYKGGFTAEMVSAMVGKPIAEITTNKLITPAAMKRLGVSEEVLSGMTYRPPTGEKLTKFNATRRANKLFGS